MQNHCYWHKCAAVPSEDSLFRMNKGVPTVQQIFGIYKDFSKKSSLSLLKRGLAVSSFVPCVALQRDVMRPSFFRFRAIGSRLSFIASMRAHPCALSLIWIPLFRCSGMPAFLSFVSGQSDCPLLRPAVPLARLPRRASNLHSGHIFMPVFSIFFIFRAKKFAYSKKFYYLCTGFPKRNSPSSVLKQD